MDKETLSNYGWIVICVLVLSVMIALATPFGGYIRDAFNATANGLFDTNENALDSALEGLGVFPTPEQLQEQYEFKYFSSLESAMSGTEDATSENASVGSYADNGVTHIVLLEDTTLNEKVTTSADMTLNLGGHVLSVNNDVCINVLGGNFTIDGRLSGSTVQNNYVNGSSNSSIIHCMIFEGDSNVTIKSGTYICNTDAGSPRSRVFFANETSNLTIQNATISGKSTNSRVDAICVAGNASASISDCSIVADVTQGNNVAYGVYNVGSTIITNCSIKAYSGLNGSYSHNAIGVENQGALTLNNCNVMSVHSGVQNKGSLYVNGGVYEGYSHGGFYFSGTSTTAYVRNATIKDCEMPAGYTDAGSARHGAGFYFGGASTANNNKIYIDNCEIDGAKTAFNIRSSVGEKNNTVYISNSRIDTNKKITIGSDTHKLYIGAGNNFTADNTNRPTSVVETGETYIMN